MLKRWNSLVYDVELLLRTLDFILESMNIEEKIKERGIKERGRSPKRQPIIYSKALVLKEVYKTSLRYSEFLFLSILGLRIPKSTLNYWKTVNF